MGIELRELTAEVRADLAAVVIPEAQQRFVSTVAQSLEEAEEYPQANPWFRGVYADGVPVGFVMISWDVVPDPPEIHGPWFLWKLIIDQHHQGRGHGQAVVRQIADLVQENGGSELLTSFVDEPGGPKEFYRKLGFVPTGEYDDAGEVILRLPITSP
jgi:diamine N-acetyltransferase